MTICYACQHCDRTGPNALCTARIAERETRTNYVTGERYRLPVFCGDRNRDGNCADYEAKSEERQAF